MDVTTILCVIIGFVLGGLTHYVHSWANTKIKDAALHKAELTFLRYRQNHLAKGPEHAEKAEVNRKMAEMCRLAQGSRPTGYETKL